MDEDLTALFRDFANKVATSARKSMSNPRRAAVSEAGEPGKPGYGNRRAMEPLIAAGLVCEKPGAEGVDFRRPLTLTPAGWDLASATVFYPPPTVLARAPARPPAVPSQPAPIHALTPAADGTPKPLYLRWVADDAVQLDFPILAELGTINPHSVGRAEGEPGGRRAGPPRFSMTAYTGAPMRLPGFDMPVVVDLDGMDVGQQRLPMLLDHLPMIDNVVGQSEAVEVRHGQLLIRGFMIEATAAGRKTVELSRAGFAWQASIGAIPLKIRRLDARSAETINGRTVTGPVYVADRTRLFEVSFVVLGADLSTSASVSP